jgi:hypothetical protein
VATFVNASSQGQRTHSARTNTKNSGLPKFALLVACTSLGPILATFVSASSPGQRTCSTQTNYGLGFANHWFGPSTSFLYVDEFASNTIL